MAKVSFQTGIPASAQETSFMNATLQSSGRIAFSIATHVRVPEHYVRAGQRAVGQYLQAVLSKALDNAEFEVQIGRDDGDD